MIFFSSVETLKNIYLNVVLFSKIARMFDFFDSGIMEGLQHRLLISSALASGPDGSLVFRGRKMGRRVPKSGIPEIYVSWIPSDMWVFWVFFLRELCNWPICLPRCPLRISDEWIQEPKDVSSPITKTVAIESLDNSERIALQEHLRSLYKREVRDLEKESEGCDIKSAPKFKVVKTSGGPVTILEDVTVCQGRKEKHHRKPPKKVHPSWPQLNCPTTQL